MGNVIPASAPKVLEKALDIVKMRANAHGEVFGGEIADALREAGVTLSVNRLDVLLTRTVLVRAMESLGEMHPAEVVQDYEHRMPVSEALRYLSEAIEWTTRLRNSTEAFADLAVTNKV
jgi:hypothetical protein